MDVKIEDVSLTCNAPLEVFNNEVNRLSRMHNVRNMKLMMIWDMIHLIGDDEVELANEESSDDEDDIAKVFRIDNNIFNYETPLCSAFKEFNCLFEVDPNLLRKDIIGFKTYKDYKNDWIYEWNKDIPWVDEKPWTNTEV
ncbi:hypothetical protein Tco_0696356 [Tanacetum coccineum]